MGTWRARRGSILLAVSVCRGAGTRGLRRAAGGVRLGCGGGGGWSYGGPRVSRTPGLCLASELHGRAQRPLLVWGGAWVLPSERGEVQSARSFIIGPGEVWPEDGPDVILRLWTPESDRGMRKCPSREPGTTPQTFPSPSLAHAGGDGERGPEGLVCGVTCRIVGGLGCSGWRALAWVSQFLGQGWSSQFVLLESCVCLCVCVLVTYGRPWNLSVVPCIHTRHPPEVVCVCVCVYTFLCSPSASSVLRAFKASKCSDYEEKPLSDAFPIHQPTAFNLTSLNFALMLLPFWTKSFSDFPLPFGEGQTQLWTQ